MVSIPGLGRSPGEGHGNPLQYSCLENPMGFKGRAAWRVTKSQTQLSNFHYYYYDEYTEKEENTNVQLSAL